MPADDDAVGAVFRAGDVLLQDEGAGWGRGEGLRCGLLFAGGWGGGGGLEFERRTSEVPVNFRM